MKTLEKPIRLVVLLAPLFCLVFLTTSAHALPPLSPSGPAAPPLPYSPWGALSINGSAAPDGLEVTAMIADVGECGSTTTIQGDYAVNVRGNDPDTQTKDGGEEGDTVVFVVDGCTASPTGSWSSGTSVELDLSVTTPEADAGGPYEGDRTEIVTLVAGGSTVPDGATPVYEWLVNGSSVYSGENAVYELPLTDYALGQHSVTLIVTVDGTCADQDTTTLDVHNAPPVANDVSANTDEDSAVTIDVTANDTDPDGTIAPDTLEIVNSPSHGSVQITTSTSTTGIPSRESRVVSAKPGSTQPLRMPLAASSAVIRYTPDLGFHGTDSFSYRVKDNDGDWSNEANVTVVVNASPAADAGGAYTGDRTETVTLDGSGSDDPDGTIATYEWQVGGSQVYAGGDPTYDLDLAGYTLGTHDVTLIVTDDQGATDQDDTELVVSNAPPVANDDTAITDQNTPVDINVTANDSDPDGSIDPTSVTIVADPNDGTVSVDGDGTVTYTPDTGTTGSDSFTYTVDDNDGATSDVATVSITVNAPPVAEAGGPYAGTRPDTVTLDGGGSDDPDGSIVTYVWEVDGVQVYAGSSDTYGLPLGDYTLGNHTVTLIVTDNQGATDQDTATLAVSNASPLADAGGPYEGDRTETVTLDAGASEDADGSIDTYTWQADGVQVYSGPSDTYPLSLDAYDLGTYDVVLIVEDGDGATDEDTTTLTVSNASPLADAGGPYEGDRAETVTLDGTGSDDPDGSIVTYQWLVDGTEVASGAGATHELSLAGREPGIYEVLLVVTDDDGDTGQDTASLTVENVPPQADADGPYGVDRSQSVTLDGSGSTDPDGSIVNFEWQVDGSQVYSGSSATYDLPLAGYELGAHDVVLIVTDNDGATDEDTATLVVTNAPPVAVDDSAATDQDASVAVDVLANDNDPDGALNPTTVTIVDGPDDGSVSVGANGVVTYTPDADFFGSDSFTYTVDDDEGATSNEATVRITVNAHPVAVDDEVGTMQNTPVDVEVLTNDYDPDGPLDRTSVAIVDQPDNGSVSVRANGVVTYTPEDGFVGEDTFTYTVDDHDGATSNVATVTVNVAAAAPEEWLIYLPLVSGGG